MKIGEKIFVARCYELGFRGNSTAMYRYLDCDRSGSVSILEMDSNASIVLARFKALIDERFQGDPDKMFRHLDRNRSGRLSRDDVMFGLLKVGYEGPAEELFDLLDREGLGHVVASNLQYFRAWKPRRYMFCEPDHDALKRLKDSFIQVNGSPLFKTWRNFMDKQCDMRISWDDFCHCCRRHRKHAAAKGLSDPLCNVRTEEQMNERIAEIWRALDIDCSGWIALKEFDVCCYKALKQFKHWAQREYGGVVIALKKIDDNNTGKVSQWELRKSGFQGDIDALFEHLDFDKGKSLGEHEVKFLDDWDIVWEEYEERTRTRRRTTAFMGKSSTLASAGSIA